MCVVCMRAKLLITWSCDYSGSCDMACKQLNNLKHHSPKDMG